MSLGAGARSLLKNGDDKRYGLDKIDQKILGLLSENSRMSAAEIGRRVGRSRVAVTERIERMLETGEIKGFTVICPPKPFRAIYEVVLSERGTCDAVMAQVGLGQTLVSASSVAGAADLFLILETDTAEELHSVRQKLTGLPEVSRVTTHVVTRSFR